MSIVAILIKLIQETDMRFFAGFIIGIVVATVGFTGMASLLDSGVSKVKATVQEHAHK